MGGLGSGNWYRWDRKTTTEEVRRLDIRYMRKQCGIHCPGSAGSLSWSRGGEPTGSIAYRVQEEHLVLNYRYRSYGEDWQDYRESIQLDRTPCNYGGERIWFLCPHCSKRVAVLYGADVRFLCRHCYCLPYASQNETYMDRMARKARKIRRRLGSGEGLDELIWEKPKGMHWTTFESLRVKEAAANDASTQHLIEKLALFKGLDWV
jgi:hypothetical protein